MKVTRPQPITRMFMPRLFALLALLVAFVATPALADPVPPEQAFPLSARALIADTVELRFDTRKAYYLYDDKLGFASLTEGVTLGTPEIPPGQTYKDEFFGDTEIHRGRLNILLPINAPAGTASVEIEVKSQGCWDGGICYPPETRTVRVELGDAAAGQAGGLLDRALSPATPAPQASGDPAPTATAVPASVIVCMAAQPASSAARARTSKTRMASNRFISHRPSRTVPRPRQRPAGPSAE